MEASNLSEFLHEPSILHGLYSLGIPAWVPEIVFFIPVAGIIFILLLRLGISRPGKQPTLFQTAMEWYADWIINLVEGSIHHQREKFYTYFGALHGMILIMSVMSLIPGFLAPTSDWRVPSGLAVISLVMVHVHGIKTHGWRGYFDHFTEGNPWLAPMLVPIHLIIELTALTTLTLRLFANIFAGHILTLLSMHGALTLMEIFAVTIFGAKIGVPVPLPILVMPLELFKGWLYALVTTKVVLEYVNHIEE